MSDESEGAESLTATRRSGFTKLHGHSYDTVDAGRKVRVTKRTRMHRFGSGYQDTGREMVVFDGSESDARMLREILDEVIQNE